MIGKIVILALCAGHDALKLQKDEPVSTPVDFNRVDTSFDENQETDAGPVMFGMQYRMELVRKIQKYTFDDFIAEHDRTYEKDTDEYKKRAAIFYNRKTETIRLAGLAKLTWTPALNKFMDHTQPEIKARLGYKPSRAKSSAVRLARKPMEEIPTAWEHKSSLNWVPNMTYSVDFQKDQGACGSCWATATAAAVEAHADVHFGMSVPLSTQQLVSCTPNEKHCGGTGGCGGATAELALDYLAEAGGMAMEKSYPYTSMWGDNGECFAEKVKEPAVLIGGYTGVPQNNLAATMYAVSKGPVVVAVDASSWSFYGQGIFSSCPRDATLNHAVLLVGYGKQGLPGQKKGYWLIRNSWGHDWGMNGYIRVSRNLQATKATFCGMDYQPEEGSACEGETDPVKVCGMCGILYEPVLPIVTGVNKPADFDSIIADVRLNKHIKNKRR